MSKKKPVDIGNPARDLSAEIMKLSHPGRYRPDEWLTFLCRDVLAGFGNRLQTPWDEERREALFELSSRYARLVAANPWRDILGEVYMDLASHGHRKWMGQYFTPQHVSAFMAEMTFHDLDVEAHPKDRFIKVLEPASGAGSLLLSVCQFVTLKHGPQSLRRMSFTAVDLDSLCTAMTATQLLTNGHLHGVLGEVVVYRGNALVSTAHWEVVTHMLAAPLAMDAPFPPVTPATAPERIEAVRDFVAAEQLSLFDESVAPRPTKKEVA